MQLSYSKLKTFGECALKYRYTYLERLPKPPVKALTFHRQLHAALAKYHFYARRDGRVKEAAHIREEKKWMPCEGEACRTCPFWSVCPAKTGEARSLVPVWQQGELRWEEVLPHAPTASAVPAPPQQTTLFDVLNAP